MTIKNCTSCDKKVHPEELNEISKNIQERFNVIMCDDCIVNEILPDSRLEGLRMQKPAETEQ